jgi:hypothetical protein
VREATPVSSLFSPASRGFSPPPPAAPAAGGWGNPGSLLWLVNRVGLGRSSAGIAVEVVVMSGRGVVPPNLPLSDGVLGGVVGDLAAFGARRSSGLLSLRSLHLAGKASAPTRCDGDSVLRLRPRSAVASSSGGGKLVRWCVGGLAAPASRLRRLRRRWRSLGGGAVGGRGCWSWSFTVSGPVTAWQADLAAVLHAWRCSRVAASRWFGSFCSDDGGAADALRCVVYSFRMYLAVPVSVFVLCF